MKASTASAVWEGGLKDGNGVMKLPNGQYEGPFTFTSRFQEGKGTNPEEMIGAAHAGCFSMALSAALEAAGFKANSIQTTAKVTMETTDAGPGISLIELDTVGDVPGIDAETFQQQAEGAKKNCPVSKALAAVDIRLNARLA